MIAKLQNSILNKKIFPFFATSLCFLGDILLAAYVFVAATNYELFKLMLTKGFANFDESQMGIDANFYTSLFDMMYKVTIGIIILYFALQLCFYASFIFKKGVGILYVKLDCIFCTIIGLLIIWFQFGKFWSLLFAIQIILYIFVYYGLIKLNYRAFQDADQEKN